LTLTPFTVLVIEDNLANIELIVRLFDRWPNVRFITAILGQSGLDLAAEHQPDAILLDLHLPDMTGHTVLRALQTNPKLKQVPVIIISADAFSEQSESLMKDGAFQYITKPFDLLALMAAVDEALEERVRRRAADRSQRASD
jgi:CheY-like chemotaxis protein